MWQLIPSLQQYFPTYQGEKHPLNEGNLGSLLVSLWLQRTVIVETVPDCYLLPHQPLLLHYIICILFLALSLPRQLMLWPLVQHHGSMCLFLAFFEVEWRFSVGEWGTHCVTVCPVLASSLGRGACFLLKENKSLNENDKLRAEDVFLATAKAPVPDLAVTLP